MGNLILTIVLSLASLTCFSQAPRGIYEADTVAFFRFDTEKVLDRSYHHWHARIKVTRKKIVITTDNSDVTYNQKWEYYGLTENKIDYRYYAKCGDMFIFDNEYGTLKLYFKYDENQNIYTECIEFMNFNKVR